MLTLRSIPLNWQALALLYEGLIQLSPTLGALVSHAAAIAEAQGLEYGLTRLDAIDHTMGFQYFYRFVHLS